MGKKTFFLLHLSFKIFELTCAGIRIFFAICHTSSSISLRYFGIRDPSHENDFDHNGCDRRGLEWLMTSQISFKSAFVQSQRNFPWMQNVLVDLYHFNELISLGLILCSFFSCGSCSKTLSAAEVQMKLAASYNHGSQASLAQPVFKCS